MITDSILTSTLIKVDLEQEEGHRSVSSDQVPLDYSKISGTHPQNSDEKTRQMGHLKGFPKSRGADKRFPANRWYGLAFQDFAEKYLLAGYSYLGVDCLGDVATASGQMQPRWSEFARRRALSTIYSFVEDNKCKCQQAPPIAEQRATWCGHFITLTVKHGKKGSYQDMTETVRILRECWNKVRRYVARKNWRFLRVMEPGEVNGYPHYHLIILGAIEQDVEAFLDRWVTAANSLGNDARREAQNCQYVENIRNLGAYVAKYVSKSFGLESSGISASDNKNYWRWVELCYRQRIRTFAMDSKSAEYVRHKYAKLPSGIGNCSFVFEDS